MDSDRRLSPNAALILCAMGYADSLHKSEESADHLRSQLSEYLEEATRARAGSFGRLKLRQPTYKP